MKTIIYYYVFDLKLVADIIYMLMKPLEWFFLVFLYTFDRHPENRIAKQYMSIEDRIRMERLSHCKTESQKHCASLCHPVSVVQLMPEIPA